MIFKLNINGQVEYVDALNIYRINEPYEGRAYTGRLGGPPLLCISFSLFNANNEKILNINVSYEKKDEEKTVAEFTSNHKKLIGVWVEAKADILNNYSRNFEEFNFTLIKQIEPDDIKEYNADEIKEGINLIKKEINDKH